MVVSRKGEEDGVCLRRTRHHRDTVSVSYLHGLKMVPGRGDVSTVKNTGCSSRASEFGSHDPCGG